MSRVAFLFPGQGAQRAGMGKDFYEVSAVARKVIDEAGEWLGLGLLPVSMLCCITVLVLQAVL